MISGLDDERLRTADLTLGAGAGTACAIVIAVFTVLAVRKLARLDVP